MKRKIKEIHNKLSINKIDSYDSLINISTFNSVSKDRFIAELKKLNVHWDLEPVSINELLKQKSDLTNKVDNKIPTKSINKESSIGIDIQNINNLPVVKDPWEEPFYTDNFTKSEIAYCLKKENIYESFSGIYALKEAIFKVNQIEKKDINISYDENGKPKYKDFFVSISHDNEYSIAVAFLKLKENQKNQHNILDEIQKLEIKNYSLKRKIRINTILILFLIFSLLVLQFFPYRFD